MVIFNDPVPVENPATLAVMTALEMRETIGALIDLDTATSYGQARGYQSLT